MNYQLREGAVRKRVLATRFLLLTTAFSVAITAASFNFAGRRASATMPGTNLRANLTSSGAQLTSDTSNSSMSRDGKYVVFTTQQNSVVSGDTNNKYDVFVRDISGVTTTRVSVSTSGVSSNGDSIAGAISQTGRYVVFGSYASNLIDGRTITSSYEQMYMRDTVAGTTTLLSEVSPGTYANGATFPGDVSADGRFVLFSSYATNLGPTITNSPYYNLFVLDRSTGTVTWVNAQASGAPAYNNDIYGAQMSCDGSFIVFDSSASYLGLPSSSHVDVFLFDRRGGDKLTDLTASANGAALSPRISCNGNYIGFTSYANNLDPITAGMSLNYHGYVYDRINGGFKLVDQSTSGTIPTTGIIAMSPPGYLNLSLSDSGNVVFGSPASGLDPAASPSAGVQMYVRNPQAGTTELLTRDSGGTQGDAASAHPVISLDGTKVEYDSYATNLISGDTNSQRDIFVSDTGL